MKKNHLEKSDFSPDELGAEIHQQSRDNGKINSIAPGSEVLRMPISPGRSELADIPLTPPSTGPTPLKKNKNAKQVVYACSLLIIGVIAGFEGKGVLDRYYGASTGIESKKKPKKALSQKNPPPENSQDEVIPAQKVSDSKQAMTPVLTSDSNIPTPETSDAAPKLKFFNAYRTRTFWSIDKLSSSKQQFSVAIRIENLAQRTSGFQFPWKPFIGWELKGQADKAPRGRISLQNLNTPQVVKIPPEAWQQTTFDEVLLELSMGWERIPSNESSAEVKTEKYSKEKALVRLRSLASILGQNPNASHLVRITAKESPYHTPAKGGFWLTSWGKLDPASSLEILFAPGTSAQVIAETLRLSTDFSVVPQTQSTSDITWDEVWVSQGKPILSINKKAAENAKIFDDVRQTLSKKMKSTFKFKGSPQTFLCDLSIVENNEACLSKSPPGDLLFLYTPKGDSPFIQIKKNVLKIPAAREMLLKEGSLLFSSPVTMI